MASNEEDPFLQVQADVLAQLSHTRPLFTSYLRIRSLSSSTSPSPELLSSRSDLEASLTTLADDLSDLVSSVEAIQSSPTHFGLPVSEVLRRKRLVDDVGNEVEDMRLQLRNSLQNAASSSGRPLDEEMGVHEQDNFGEYEQQEQLRIMAEQDHALDGVFGTVRNIRMQADDMGRELEEQVEMLEHIDSVADRVGGKLQSGARQLGAFARRNEDTWSGCCIGVLIFVLIILLVLLLVL